MIRPLIIAGLAIAAAAPAAAQTVDQDVKCMLASNVFATQEKDPQRKQIAQASALYYFGRVDGRVPLPQLKDKILTVGKSFTPATLGPVMTTCARQLQDRQKALQDVGRQVAAAAPKGPPPKK